MGNRLSHEHHGSTLPLGGEKVTYRQDLGGAERLLLHKRHKSPSWKGPSKLPTGATKVQAGNCLPSQRSKGHGADHRQVEDGLLYLGGTVNHTPWGPGSVDRMGGYHERMPWEAQAHSITLEVHQESLL